MLRVSRLCQWQCEWWSLIPRELWNLSKGPLRTSFWGSKTILTDKEDTAFPEAAGTSRVPWRMDTSRRTPWESKGAFFDIVSPQVFSACLLKMNLDVIKYHVILTDHLFFWILWCQVLFPREVLGRELLKQRSCVWCILIYVLGFKIR